MQPIPEYKVVLVTKFFRNPLHFNVVREHEAGGSWTCQMIIIRRGLGVSSSPIEEISFNRLVEIIKRREPEVFAAPLIERQLDSASAG